MRRAESQHRDHRDVQRSKLPSEPGCYIYSDPDGEVLYVGKAKDIKKRVNSYFTKAHGARTHALVMHIANIEVVVLSSEQEALIVEDQLVKKHRPPFNVMLRDDKSYPFIAVTLRDDFPRVLFTREKHRTGTKYFGPYSNARRVRISLDLLNRIFPYRPCEGREPGRQSGIPCLDFHIERCAAPCIGNISKAAYRAVIDEVMQVLRGNAGPTRTRLTADMQAASRELEFEKAARVRNRLRDLEKVVELQAAEHPGSGSFDVLGAAAQERRRGSTDGDGGELASTANVQLLQVRDGRITDRSSHFLDNADGLEVGTVLVQFALNWYGQGRPVPHEIVVGEHAISDEDAELLANELTILRGTAVEVRRAERGDKRRVAELAERNAVHALRYDSIRERARVERRAAALEGLRDELQLDSLPIRIECYDISNLGEQHPVASMVVTEDGKAKKSDYRRFAMHHEHGQNDFAMMAEVITRRFTRLAASQERVAQDAALDAERESAADLVEAEQRSGVEPTLAELPPVDAGSDVGEMVVDDATGAPTDTAATAASSTESEPEPEPLADPTDQHDTSFAAMPDLVVIDGGKGQLAAAVEALRELGIERVNICSLAKQYEEIYLPGRSLPIVLDRQSPSLHLLQRTRDEAHRFAVSFHRARRGKEFTGSVLDSLEGIGAARRRAMLNFFGSPERVINATLEELESVPGLPAKVARRVHEQLNRLGSASQVAPRDAAGAPEPPRDDVSDISHVRRT